MHEDLWQDSASWGSTSSKSLGLELRSSDPPVDGGPPAPTPHRDPDGRADLPGHGRPRALMCVSALAHSVSGLPNAVLLIHKPILGGFPVIL